MDLMELVYRHSVLVNLPVTSDFPSQRAGDKNIDVFFVVAAPEVELSVDALVTFYNDQYFSIRIHKQSLILLRRCKLLED